MIARAVGGEASPLQPIWQTAAELRIVLDQQYSHDFPSYPDRSLPGDSDIKLTMLLSVSFPSDWAVTLALF